MIEREGELRENPTYSDELTKRFPLGIKMLELGDVWGEPREGHEDIWKNVAEHCFTQAKGCRIVGVALGLSNESISNLEYAAMIHDWDKKFQMDGLKRINSCVTSGEISPQQAGEEKYYFFDRSEKHSALGLRNNNIPEIVIQIASTDGHPALERVSDPASTLEERIFHYLGSITDGDAIVPLDQRIDNLETKPAYALMNEFGRKLDWKNGRTLYQMQREVGHVIEQELVTRLIESCNLDEVWTARLLENPKDLPLFITFKIQEEYSK
jgi:hypothetical protein